MLRSALNSYILLLSILLSTCALQQKGAELPAETKLYYYLSNDGFEGERHFNCYLLKKQFTSIPEAIKLLDRWHKLNVNDSSYYLSLPFVSTAGLVDFVKQKPNNKQDLLLKFTDNRTVAIDRVIQVKYPTPNELVP